MAPPDAFCEHAMQQNATAAEALPRTPLGELTALSKLPVLTGIFASVCPSVCNAVQCGAQNRCSWKLYRRISSTALPIHFFGHFCYRMYRSATKHSEKQKRWNFPVRNSNGQPGHVTMAIPDVAFLAVPFCSYTVRIPYLVCSTIGLLSDSMDIWSAVDFQLG